MENLWNTVLYEPMVNALAFFTSLSGGDIGLAIILLTVVVKTILFPLSQRSIESQAKMKLLEPEINKIKSSGLSKEEQAKKTFELYKQTKTNPFSGCLLILIQIPIIFALYFAFYKGLKFDEGLLYSFVKAPAEVNNIFLGLIDLTGKSLFLAILAGVSQYFQAHFMPKPTTSAGGKGGFAESFGKSMHMQMKYVFPFLVAFFAYSISGAVALYWVVSNVFAVGQQIYSNKKMNPKKVEVKPI